ncbi:hypothetical protein C5167_030462 [Papaver somniferum]|uniref:protein O-linked-mannose beta-1,4-N-acetylglucosaminyltransferase 2-like n=1 Tax=Papaver somniferum TaxID=3469 RepID=UPI000E6FCAB4|nr:protein O-linked-mannose beta-1,4-N-acetylglucosaminyltransferase 2-like [Papaver somniferum]XP_026431796.1 protein O-linked-mannose beta-1,4-N-acetylglucosaminyltransferase 2-like [Papaver somniferum]RZC86380.1 hypothetical protein C5167_030462 [Papaver somniferum]
MMIKMKKRGSNGTSTTTTLMIGMTVSVLFFLIHRLSTGLLFNINDSISSPSSLTEKYQGFVKSELIKEKTHDGHDLMNIIGKQPKPKTNQFIINCDTSHDRYDLCILNSTTTLDPTNSTFYVDDDPSSSITSPPSKKIHKIRPYPRKWENFTMARIKELTIVPTSTKIDCHIQHQAPALVFSAGGYTGNLFHDFNDGFIPLFVTMRSTFPNGVAPILVVSLCREWWLQKYAELLRQFSPYPIINLDNDSKTHCFPSTTTIGLISHGYMTINPTLLPNSDSFLNFRKLVGSAYDTKTSHYNQPAPSRPRLVLTSRTGRSRVILNQAEVILLAKEVGFEVSIFEPNEHTSLKEAYKLINSSHVMVGVHGAALTHSLFLRPKSILIQVVPVGIDWLAETCFGKSAKDMGLEYMEYRINVNESSLVDKYGKDHLVLKDPKAVMKDNWSNTKDIYLNDQNVRVDLIRFRRYLTSAYKKAKNFMDEL